MSRVRLLPAMLALVLPFAAARADEFATQVKTHAGVVAGAVDQGVLSFKGIPYAQPPLGNLRWREPLPVKPWQGVREATRYGHDCMQLPFPADDAPIRTTADEDCLVLNVWRPAPANARPLPVMVWIYGGGFTIGGTSPAIYDGSTFARDGVILVSMNYRLGRFGFFAHPALTAENPKGLLGNYGYMDQIAALRWVQQNIAAFGGDPRHVTVFGESAGGGSVNMLMTSPLARGLFAAAIVESGGGRGSRMGPRRLGTDLPNVPSGETIGVNFAKSQGIEDTGAAGLAKLRALPAAVIQAGVGFGVPRPSGPPTIAGPMQDGRIVTADAGAIYQAGGAAKVPFMIGANSADIGGFSVMIEPARYVAATLAAQGRKAWEYRFGYVVDSMRATWKTGTPHAKEIPFVFDTLAARYGTAVTAHDAAVAKTTHDYWVNFGKAGDPNGSGLPAWPAYSAAADELMIFQADGMAAAQPDPWKAQLDLAAQHAQSAVRP